MKNPLGREQQAPGPSPQDAETRRRLLKRWLELETLYGSWKTTHQEIVEYIQPGRGQFVQTDSNRGTRKDAKVINNAAGEASEKLEAAIDTGVTSEANEWFTLAPQSPELAEASTIREYCHEVQSILFGLIARSTWYKANRNLIADIIGPATGLMFIEEDEEDVFRCTHVPVGTYRIAVDSRGRVNLVVRRYVLTADQMAGEFGEDNCSPSVRQALKNGTTQIRFQVLQVVERRAVRDSSKHDPKNKPWASTWLEIGSGLWGALNPILGNGEVNDPLGPSGILRESGFDEQPFICVRWNAIGMDAYGRGSPGWRALGDAKQLQALELGGSKAVAKIIDPPMSAPDALKNASLLPGAINRISVAGAKFEPSVVIPPQTIEVLRLEKQAVEQRIGRSFYSDILFLISADQRATPATAEEIRGKKEERLLQLGGVFARYADEGLKQAIGRILAIAQRRGLLPEPPRELLDAGGALKIDFQNPLVTAQKTIAFSGVQQLISTGIAVAQARAAGADKLDGDEIMDTAAEVLGVKPNLLKSDEQLAQERQQAQAAQQGKQMGESMTQAAPAIKALSDSDPERLRQMVQQFGPQAAAMAGLQ